ncbi:phosphotransferase [candidate division KSB1 bacterium]|nr:phosphotransferase [candidate division KSB1 bacterium]
MEALTHLQALFETTYHEPISEMLPLKGDGSERKIYRLKNPQRSVIGIIGNSPAENKAFVAFTRHFFDCGLRVPQIYAEDLARGVYLEEDLGDATLFEWMGQIRAQEGFSHRIIAMYQKVLSQLPHFQIRAGAGLDYSLCYQHREFGWASMVWDVHYFKHRFLDVFYQRPLDVGELEKDFIKLIEFLVSDAPVYFLYRDFQSRNIMIRDHEPHFIDYQSGRKGALQYDVASLLYDAKANIPEPVREHLVAHYLQELRSFLPVDEVTFKQYYYGFVLIRVMQACGAYGYLGVARGKAQFLKSIPFAIRNLELLLTKDTILNSLPTLKEVFTNLTQDEKLRHF